MLQLIFILTLQPIGPVVQWIEYLPAGRQGSFQMMKQIVVYAIKSEIDGRIYVGMTSNISKRLYEHNSGKTKSTKGYKPWRLIYTELLPSRSDAREREKYLKSGIGKEFLKSLVP